MLSHQKCTKNRTSTIIVVNYTTTTHHIYNKLSMMSAGQHGYIKSPLSHFTRHTVSKSSFGALDFTQARKTQRSQRLHTTSPQATALLGMLLAEEHYLKKYQGIVEQAVYSVENYRDAHLRDHTAVERTTDTHHCTGLHSQQLSLATSEGTTTLHCAALWCRNGRGNTRWLRFEKRRGRRDDGAF